MFKTFHILLHSTALLFFIEIIQSLNSREITIEMDSLKLTNDYQIDINPTTKAGVGESTSIKKLDSKKLIFNYTMVNIVYYKPADTLRIIWDPKLKKNPESYFYVKYKLKNDTDFENTVPERKKSYINIKGVEIGQKYNVILVAVDGNDTRESDITEIVTTHEEHAPKIVKFPENTQVVDGGYVYMGCNVIGEPKLNTIWKKNNVEISGDHYVFLDCGDLEIKEVQMSDSGNYTCITYNKHGIVAASALITVKAKHESGIMSVKKWFITIFIALLVLIAFLLVEFYKYVIKHKESMQGLHKAVLTPDQYNYSKITSIYNGDSQPLRNKHLIVDGMMPIGVYNDRDKRNPGEQSDCKSTYELPSIEGNASVVSWSGPYQLTSSSFPWGDLGLNTKHEEFSIQKDDPWEIPRQHLRFCSMLGEGCFGQVWKCEVTNNTGIKGNMIVAVKTLKGNAGERERVDLIQELQVMKSLEPHPNVVKLLGCCSEKDPLFVIMEFAELGKLQTVLRNSRNNTKYLDLEGMSSLTSHELIIFCYQIAIGMDFLTSKKIVHRDLAARNVLVAADRTCKVSDFGFSRDLDDRLVYERRSGGGPLPVRWMAPEALHDNVYTARSDVWSYGVLVWEVVTLGSTPYPGMSARAVVDRTRHGYRMPRPDHCGETVYAVMRDCWAAAARDRPGFAALVARLRALVDRGADAAERELRLRPDNEYYNVAECTSEERV